MTWFFFHPLDDDVLLQEEIAVNLELCYTVTWHVDGRATLYAADHCNQVSWVLGEADGKRLATALGSTKPRVKTNLV